jgi:hypothetical protein
LRRNDADTRNARGPVAGAYRGGKPSILFDAVWACTEPFEGFLLTIEDGAKVCNFVVPKPCGNLALLSQSEKPLAACIHLAQQRSCDTKQVTLTASGTAIANKQATVVKILHDGRQVGGLVPASGFEVMFPLQPGRYTFLATDMHGREFGTCQRDHAVEACAAPAQRLSLT